jgi:hypothetical protein
LEFSLEYEPYGQDELLNALREIAKKKSKKKRKKKKKKKKKSKLFFLIFQI